MTLQVCLYHRERIMSALRAPLEGFFDHTAFLLVPFLRSYVFNAIEVRDDATATPLFPEVTRKPVLAAVEDLTKKASFRKVDCYGCYSQCWRMSGSRYSLTNPALFLPSFLFQLDGPFGRQIDDTWHYTRNEARFLIARELVQMQGWTPLLKALSKTALIAACYFLYVTTMPPLLFLAGAVSIVFFHVLFERLCHRGVDERAVLLTGDLRGAVGALEKMRKQNLERRETHPFAWLYISASGENRFDTHKSLAGRIEELNAKMQSR